MIEQFLNRIMGSLKDNESSDRKFRDEAAKNDKTLFSSIKDLSKRFSISEQNIDSINDSIESTNVEVQRSNQKIDSMQGLIRESISMQAQMLTELGAIKSDFKDLKESIEKTSGDSGGNIVGNFLNDLKQGAKSLGLGVASLAGLGVIDAGLGGIDALVDMFKENFGGFDTTGELTGGSPSVSESSQGAGEQTSKGASTAVNKDIPIEARAFLDSLTAPGYEGTQNFPGGGYNTIVGGKQFKGYEDHPRKVGVVTAQGPSTAAGRYQITKTTWDELRKRYPELTDFSPKNQDLAAWLLAQERYSANNRGNLLDALKSNDPKVLAGVERALAGTWSSLRGGVHQGSSAGSFSNFYSKNLENLQKQTPEEENTKNDVEGDNTGTYRKGATSNSGPTGNNVGGKVTENNVKGEGDETGTHRTPKSGPTGGNVRYTNQGATRNQEIQPRLMTILQNAAKETGVDVEIFSGGQPKKGSGGKRVGSTRHDDGNAADIILKRGKETVLDKKTIGQFIAAAARGGATGIGHGPGYMQPGGIHIGFGKPSVWGAGGKSKNAPGWVRSAASGVFSNENLQDDSNGAQGNGTNSSSARGSLDFSGFSALESGLAGLGISLPTGGLLSAISNIFGFNIAGSFENLASAFGLTGGNVNDSQYQQQTSSQEIVKQTSSQENVKDTPENSESIKLALSGPLFGSRSVTPAGESQSRSNTRHEYIPGQRRMGSTPKSGTYTLDDVGREADDFPGNFVENLQRNFSLVMDTMSKEKTITQENQPASPQDYSMAMGTSSAPNVDYNGGNRWYNNPEKTAFANWARGDNWVIEPISGIKKNQPEWFNRTMFA